ncbi:ABC transporter ATP-binding protein [Paenibacillus alkalitolerans]|uniref:ABC transporter ATP-binding protein n=1 Tax=Paenibacillus alkalitolerans TaxID=2799335 RepID=UPI0018F52B35|nr:ABC transporter ATP-binding protein [Paenibacillus alkalitolerans]
MIHVSSCCKSYGGYAVLDNVSFDVRRGEMFGVIGPNGSGKSTLLRLLSGLEPASGGTVAVDGRPVASYKRKELARWLAVLQQDALPPTGFSVREIVEMGRFPYQNWLGEEPEDKSELIESVMARLGLTPLAGHSVESLSGGERQRTALAKVMVQQPKLLLLDEPTTYLDIGYQIQLMDSIRSWQKEADLTVIAVLHDLNLAAQYCNRIMIIHGGRVVRIGKPEDVIVPETIDPVYGARTTVLPHPVTGTPQVLLNPSERFSTEK